MPKLPSSLKIVGLVILILGLLVAAILVTRQQLLKNKAFTPGPTTSASNLFLSPLSGTATVGEIIPVDIKFRTLEPISSIAIVLDFPTTNAQVVNSLGTPSNQYYPNNTGLPNWSFTPITIVNGHLQFIASTLSGFSSSTDTVLASLYLKVVSLPTSGNLPVTLDASQTKMYTQTDPPVNIANILATSTYAIVEPTIEPGVTPSLTPSPTPTPIPTQTPVPTLTPTLAPNITPSVTPTTTATPIPTLTPPPTGGPTPTSAPGTTTLNFKIKFQGVAIQRPNQNVRVTLRQTGTTDQVFTVPATSDASGVYSYMGSAISVTPGIYDILIKGPIHLQKKFPAVNLSTNQLHDFTSSDLKAGDITGDNTVNIFDFNLLSADFQIGVPKISVADLNLDGKVDIFDFNLLSSNFSFGIYGDQ